MDTEKHDKKNIEMANPTVLRKVRDELRRWYGSLSIKELVTNKKLVEEIERFEKQLNTLGGLR